MSTVTDLIDGTGMSEPSDAELLSVDGSSFWASAACGLAIVGAAVAVTGATAAGAATFGLAAPISAYTAGMAVGGAIITCGNAISS